jgi:WG containing repeat
MVMRIVFVLALIAFLAWPCSMSFSKGPYHKNLRSDTPLFRFEKNGKAGFIDARGKIVIPPQFDVGWFAEEDFVEGVSPARIGENWGFIDAKGKWVIQPQYWRAEPFSEGLAAVTHQLKGSDFAVAYIDKSGKEVFDFPKGVASSGPFSEGLAAIRQVGYVSVGKTGYVDRTGRVVVPYEFADGGPFHDGFAAVILDGKCYIESREGTSRGTPPSVPAASSCGGVPEGITKRCQEGFIDKTGKLIFKFDGVRDFSEGLGAVETRGKWGFINPQGKFQIEAKFEAVGSFKQGLARVRESGRWGYIDSKGSWVIPPSFTMAEDFSDELALTDIGYIDKTGRKVAAAQDGTPFVLQLAHVNLGNGEFGYINHTGQMVFRYRPAPTKFSMLPYSGK